MTLVALLALESSGQSLIFSAEEALSSLIGGPGSVVSSVLSDVSSLTNAPGSVVSSLEGIVSSLTNVRAQLYHHSLLRLVVLSAAPLPEVGVLLAVQLVELEASSAARLEVLVP